MKTLTEEQAQTLIAFIEAFELVGNGWWAPVAQMMRESYDIEDPETALEEAREALL